MGLEITTNWKPRELIQGFALTDKEAKEFDWIGDREAIDNTDKLFFRYKRWTYCLDDFVVIDNNPYSKYPEGHRPFPEPWQAYTNDTYFSGILIFTDDYFETVTVRSYYAGDE